MATTKFDLSLRVRHPEADLTPVAKCLGLMPGVNWRKGDPQKASSHQYRDSSYCSIPLGATETEDLEKALRMSLTKVSLAQQAILEVVQSGGSASIAIGWFCNGDSGARISEELLSEMARLKLQADFYLYFSSSPETEV